MPQPITFTLRPTPGFPLTVSKPTPARIPGVIGLSDNFDDNSTSASWVTGAPLVSGSVGGTVVETNQRVEVTPPSSAAGGNYNGYTSATTYDFRGSRTFVKVSNVAGLSGSQDVFFALGVNTVNYCGILVEGSSLLVHSLVAGASTLPFSTTYSSTTHAWWGLRVSSDGSTVYIETAPSTASDSPLEGDWTVLYTLAVDASWTVSTAKVGFGSGTWQSLATPNVIQFDGFNTATTSATTTTVAPSTGHLTFTGYQPAITLTTAVSPSVGHLTFGGKVPSVALTVAVAPSTGHLTFGGKTPSVAFTTNVNPSSGHLTFGGKAPALTLTTGITPTTGHLTLGGKVPSVALNVNLTPTTGHLTFTGKTPSLTTGITPATGHLVFTGYVPDVSGTVIASSALPLKVTYRHRGRNC